MRLAGDGWVWGGGGVKIIFSLYFSGVPFFPSADPASKQPVLVSAITLPKN